MSGSHKMAFVAVAAVSLWTTVAFLSATSATADSGSAPTASSSLDDLGIDDDIAQRATEQSSQTDFTDRIKPLADRARTAGALTDDWFGIQRSHIRTAAQILMLLAIAALIIGLLFMSHEADAFKAAPTGGWFALLALLAIGAAQFASLAHAVAPAWAARTLPIKAPSGMIILTLAMSAIGVVISNWMLMKSASVKGPGAFWYRLGAPVGLANLTLAIFIGWWALRDGALPFAIH